MKFIKKYLKLIILILVILILVVAGIFIYKNRNPYKNEGIKGFYYRVYSDGKWSKWCRNGDICGKKNKPITNIEFKISNNLEDGSILYNTYENGFYSGLNSVTTKLSNTSSEIEGFLLTSSGDVYNDYEIYYRTYNKKYGWLNYSNGNDALLTGIGINGAKGNPIEQLQIIILKKDSKLKINYDEKAKSSYGFEEIENTTEKSVEESE